MAKQVRKPKYISLLHQEAAALDSIAVSLKNLEKINLRNEKRFLQFINIVLERNNSKKRIK